MLKIAPIMEKFFQFGNSSAGGVNTTTTTDDKKSQKINRIVTITFISACLVFLVIYLPISFTNCTNNIVFVDYYVPDVPCTCANNVGSFAGIGKAMMANSSFYQQDISPLTWGQGLNYLVAFNNPNIIGTVYYPGAYTYFYSYFPVEFAFSVVHSKTINIFEIYDPLNLGPPILQPIYYNYDNIDNGAPGCFQIGTNYPNPSANWCLQLMQNLTNPNFTPYVELGYDQNLAYREFCNLQNCQIPQCSSAASVQILLTAVGVLGALFSVSRLVRYVLRHSLASRVDFTTQTVSMSSLAVSA
jgi:hypothetical protein